MKNSCWVEATFCVPNDKRQRQCLNFFAKRDSQDLKAFMSLINTTSVTPGGKNAKQCVFWWKKGSFSIYIRWTLSYLIAVGFTRTRRMGVWKKGHIFNPSLSLVWVPRPTLFLGLNVFSQRMSFQNLHNQKILRHLRLETPLIHARILFYSKTPNIRVGGINRANGTSRTCRKKGTNRGSRTTRSSRSSRTSWPTSTTWSSWKEIRTFVQKQRVILRKGIMKSFRLKQKKMCK